MKKKAVFFTFIALFITILVIAMVISADRYRYRDKSSAIATRVKTMDNFIEDLEKDIDRELFIGGYRALISMNSYLRITESYVEDFDSVFEAILLNGSVNGTEMTLMHQEGQGADITSWLERVNEESGLMDISVDMDVKDIIVYQEDPWNVIIVLNATIYLEDLKGQVGWEFDEIYRKKISIIGFEDPLYTVETSDKVTNLINVTPNYDFVDDATNDTSVLNDHLMNSYYIENTDAPSYLMRFTGNKSSSPYGIESMINLEDLSSQSIPLLMRSIIDYVYFGNQSTTDYCDVDGLPSWFRIDSGHLAKYEITGLEGSCS